MNTLDQYISFARKLRKNSTDTENKLWRFLRAKRFSNYKFKRQEPIGKYIVDFVCYEKRVIIECDGSRHLQQQERDKTRDQWFVDQDYKVLRFWDNDVLENTEDVLEVIFQALMRGDKIGTVI